MRKTLIIIILALSILFSYSCRDKNKLHFKLPNGLKIKYATIAELKLMYKIRYEDYHGFVMQYKDTMFTNILIKIANNSYKVGADVLNDEQIKKLEAEYVESIELRYSGNDSLTNRDTLFESTIMKIYNNYDKIYKTKNGFILKNNYRKFLELHCYDSEFKHYRIELFPIEQ